MPPPKPFACTGLVSDDTGYYFEVGLLDERLVPSFVTMLPAGTDVRLGRSTFQVEAVEWTTTSYRQLALSPPSRTWTLTFRSPTTFRGPGPGGSRRAWPFPLPNLVFGSLLRRWEQFAPDVILDARIEAVAQEHLVISAFDLRTTRYLTKIGGGALLGCVGTVSFGLVAPQAVARETCASLTALLMFANFAGLGDQTTKGMGWTTLVESPPRRPRSDAKPTASEVYPTPSDEVAEHREMITPIHVIDKRTT